MEKLQLRDITIFIGVDTSEGPLETRLLVDGALLEMTQMGMVQYLLQMLQEPCEIIADMIARKDKELSSKPQLKLVGNDDAHP